MRQPVDQHPKTFIGQSSEGQIAIEQFLPLDAALGPRHSRLKGRKDSRLRRHRDGTIVRGRGGTPWRPANTANASACRCMLSTMVPVEIEVTGVGQSESGNPTISLTRIQLSRLPSAIEPFMIRADAVGQGFITADQFADEYFFN